MGRCVWTRGTGQYSYDTECGDYYNPYIKSEQQPKIEQNVDGEDICPYCGKLIEYSESNEEEDEEEEDYYVEEE